MRRYKLAVCLSGFFIAVAVYSFSCSIFAAESPVLPAADIVIGSEKSPITIIEYSSLNCTACARFHRDVFPVIRKKYIDTGMVRFIFRHFPLDETAAGIAAIVMEAPEVMRFTLVQRIFERQTVWGRAVDTIRALAEIVNMPVEECRKITENRKLTDAILAKRLEAEQQMKIEATPTLLINGRVIDHAPKLSEIEPLLSGVEPHKPRIASVAFSEKSSGEEQGMKAGKTRKK